MRSSRFLAVTVFLMMLVPIASTPALAEEFTLTGSQTKEFPLDELGENAIITIDWEVQNMQDDDILSIEIYLVTSSGDEEMETIPITKVTPNGNYIYHCEEEGDYRVDVVNQNPLNTVALDVTVDVQELGMSACCDLCCAGIIMGGTLLLVLGTSMVMAVGTTKRRL